LLQDFVPGYNYRYLLHQRLSNQKPFTEVEIIKIMQQILPVLDYIHSCGVIHRDISPDNLICRQVDQLPILIDFGGVKQLSANAEFQFVGGHDGSTATPTRLGKIGYAPNEQIQRGIVFPHSDLYALGATMLVLLSGVEPKEMINPRDFTWEWHRFVTLSPGFAAIIDRMLKSKPNDRFQTAKELMNALEELDYPDQSVVNKGGITPLSANVHEEPTTLTPQPSPQLPPQSAPLWQQYWLWVVGLLVAIALGITLFTIFSRDQNNGVKQRQRSFQLNVPSALVKPSPQSYH
jgi:serine/threonine-protein kinase